MASGTDDRGVPAMLTRNSHRFRCKYTRGHVYLAMQDFRYARYTVRDTHTRAHTNTNMRTQIVEKQSSVQREMKRAYARQSKHKMRFGGEPITSRLLSLPCLRRINSCEYRGLPSISFDSPVRDRKVRIGYTMRIAMSVTRFFFVERGISEHEP